MRSSIMIMSVLLLAFLLVAQAAAGQSSFGPASAEVQELRVLYARSGLAFPTTSFPLFREDVRRFAQALLDRPTEAAVAEQIRSLEERFRAAEKPVVAAEVQGCYQQFVGVPGGTPGFAEQFWLERPLARIGLGLQVDDSVSLYIQDATQKQYRFGLGDNNLPPTVAGSPFSREMDSIREGYLRVVGGAFDVVIGRQQVHLGPSDDSSLAVSGRIPFLDAAKMRLTVGPLTMTWLVSTLENRRAVEDPVLASVPSGYDFGNTLILYNVHYFEWDAGPLRAGIGAQYLVSRDYNVIQLGDVFPVFSWHNADLAPNNMSLLADLEWVPLRGLRLFAQVGFDDVAAPGAVDSPIPTIDAEIAGIVYSGVPAPAWVLSVGLTGGHTHYLWGNFAWKTADDFYLSRAIYRMDLQSANRSMPLTSPYGAGAWWGTLEGRLLAPDGALDAGLSLTLALTNPAADLHAAAYEASSVVANAPLLPQFTGAIDFAYRFNRHVTCRLRPQALVSRSASWLAFGLGIDAGL